MLTRRIIPCLDIQGKRVVKGKQFKGLKDAGDPIELAAYYSNVGTDELVLLDISATVEKKKVMAEYVKAIAEKINIPFTIGGGIRSLADAKTLLQSGADKIAINTAAFENPQLISDLSNELGQQCVVVAIDVQRSFNGYKVVTHAGKNKRGKSIVDWVTEVEENGAGEILLTSMDADGQKTGFDLRLYQMVSDSCSLPIIASGGAGAVRDFKRLFEETSISAGLAASIFHYGEVKIPDLKNELKLSGIEIRM